MIRATQREELSKLRKTLAELGKATAPSLQSHILLAVVSGEMPKLRDQKGIVTALRGKIVKDRYNAVTLNLTDVFASTEAFAKEQTAYEAHEKKRKKAVEAFEKDAGKIMIQALNKDAEATEIIEELHAAAERAGLKDFAPLATTPDED